MNLTAILSGTARHRPHKEALVAGEASWSFAKLWRRISAAASLYQERGLTVGQRVLLVLPNGPEFLFYHFGALHSGIVSVPVKADYRAWEIGQIVANCRPRLLISTTAWLTENRELLPEAAGAALAQTDVVSIEELDLDGRLAADPARGDHAPVPLPGSAVASINYTYYGGGYPKGAVLTHANHIYAATGYARHMGFTSEERFLIILPMPHVYALSGCINTGLIRGATLVILNRYTPRPIFAALQAHRITVLSAVPSLFSLLARFPKKERYDLSALRLCVTGGAFLPAAAQREYEAALGTQMVQGYGLSECLPVICNPPNGHNKHGTLGIAGRRDIHMRILGAGGETLPSGEVGEIAIAGPTTMRGYYDLPKDTAAVLRDGWLMTGDRGAIDEDGFLHYHGLSKKILNVHGNKVDLEEIRSVLLRHPEVAAVDIAGEGAESPARFDLAPKIRANVVLSDGQPVSGTDLRTYLGRRLASYKVPTEITVQTRKEPEVNP